MAETKREEVERLLTDWRALIETLASVDLEGADPVECMIQTSEILEAANPLKDADLRCADLRCADLKEADLRCADLTEADLRGTDADLGGADLRAANLTGAKLPLADLTVADLRGAKLPEGFEPDT